MSIVAPAAPSVTKVAPKLHRVAACVQIQSVYSDSHQPGSRHLVCGRCWDPPPSIAERRPCSAGPSPRLPQCFQRFQVISFNARRRSRAALRRPCSASPTAARTSSLPAGIPSGPTSASCCRYRSTCSAMTVRVAAAGSFIVPVWRETEPNLDSSFATLSVSWIACAFGEGT